MLRRGPGEGGLRHRDARPRHQHAGPDGGHREADKFTGERHELLTPGEYTQLTGRAGRRGIDDGRLRRRAVVAVRDLRAGRRPGVEPHLRHLRPRSGPPTTWRPTWCGATSRTRPTTSSTCPSPSTRPTATSCGSRPGSTAPTSASPRPGSSRLRAGRRRGVPAAAAPAGRRPRPSRPSVSRKVDDALLADAAARRRAAHPRPPQRRRRRSCCRPRRAGAASRSKVLTARKHRLTLTADDFERCPRRSGRIELPEPYTPNNCDLPARGRPSGSARPGSSTATGTSRGAVADPELDDLQRSARATTPWPTAPSCRSTSGRCFQLERLERERPQLERQVRGRSASPGPPVRPGAAAARGLGLPRRLGADPTGERLARIYHEADLVDRRVPRARALRRPRRRRRMAGLASAFTYERRGPGRRPGAVVPDRRRPGPLGARSRRSSAGLIDAEERAGLPADPRARPRLRRPGPRLGRRRRPARRARGRGALRRRLRAQHQAAHRPAPPDRRGGARTRDDPGRRPARRADALVPRRGRRRPSAVGAARGADDDDPEG